MSHPLKIIFAGTPEFAAKHLITLLDSPHKIIAVLTQPDRPAGRGNKLTASPVKQLAAHYPIPVFQPESLTSTEIQSIIHKLDADIMIVVAYGLVLPVNLLKAPRLGCINVHGSLLPRWRGAAPIQRACWAGDTETGVTIMQMNEGLDTGDILYQLSCPILATDTSDSLYEKLALLGPKALLETLKLLQQGFIVPNKQDNSLAIYAKKLTKLEAKLDWSLSATQLERCVRAFNPWPVSYFTVEETVIKVWQTSVIKTETNKPPGTIIQADKNGILVTTGKGVLNLLQLQPAGKKSMSAHDLLNSRSSWFIKGNHLN